jgi:hypothetical protein
LQILLSPFRLPETLRISLAGCDGEPDAFYDYAAITICYEYVYQLWEDMPQERAAVSDALLASRDFGVVWHWDSKERFTSVAFGLFNDWFVSRDEDFEESTSRFISRFTWAPLVSQDESNLLHLGFSYTYSDDEE